MRKLLQLLDDRSDIESVAGDVLPGPPPDFKQTMVLNLVASKSLSSGAVLDRVEYCRNLVFEILPLIADSKFEGSVSIRIFNSQTRIRDYCANFSVPIPERDKMASRICWHESSQDFDIERTLTSPLNVEQGNGEEGNGVSGTPLPEK